MVKVFEQQINFKFHFMNNMKPLSNFNELKNLITLSLKVIGKTSYGVHHHK